MTEQVAIWREHVALESEGQMVSGFLHRPAGEIEGKMPAVLMLHGLMAAKSQPPHRLFVKLADELAQQGIVSLRIDFRGRGDSEGDSIDVTPSADYNDTKVAFDFLAALPNVDTSRLAVVGISWGGTMAALLAGRDKRVAATVMWSSLPGGPSHWQPPFEDVDGRPAAYLWGNWLGRPFYEELWQLNPLAELKQSQAPLLLVYGTADEVVPAEALAATRVELEAAGIAFEVVAIEGADHVFMGHAWERQLLGCTAEWLRARLGAA